MTDDSWRAPTFRQLVASKIDEAIRQSCVPISQTSMEMENHIFQKSKTKEEYLGFVARLILHVREMNGASQDTKMSDDSWQKPTFRQSIVTIIDIAIRESRMATSRNSIEMENHVFQNAATQEAYLHFIAVLLHHVREMNTQKVNEMTCPGTEGPGMPDPINTGPIPIGNQMAGELANQLARLALENPVTSQLQGQLQNQLDKI